MKTDSFMFQVGEWLKGSGPENDIVISSRIRLARNLMGHNFPSIASDEQSAQTEELIYSKLEKTKVIPDMIYFKLKALPRLERNVLVERHLISKNHAEKDGARGLAVDKNESLSIMVNEEDHLRLQVLKSGFQLTESWKEIDEMDNRMEEELPYAFSSTFGYLTACPTNVGTGMRVSVMLHLPALTATKQIEKVFQSLIKIKFMVRGLYGEGTYAIGDFYQIANQISLGYSEKNIISEIYNIIPELIKYERGWREKLLSDPAKNLEDRIWRAYGTLRYASSISSHEMAEILSVIRLGITAGLIKDISIRTLNEIFILSQPAHLQKMKKKTLSASERDIARAQFIQDKLKMP
ncbi:MAG: protein arginine kinase [Planctomycetota bacterium]|nr:protein arginine kinase [Planctomycetota bacterium]MDI6787377.1 protein arginine kinase [Planctomycetota bacterium]